MKPCFGFEIQEFGSTNRPGIQVVCYSHLGNKDFTSAIQVSNSIDAVLLPSIQYPQV
jgi:hypothetical protein